MKVSDFLNFDKDGNVFSQTSTLSLNPNERGKLLSSDRMNIFKAIYNLCITRLGARFNSFGDFSSSLSLSNESDFLNYIIKEPQFFTLDILLDLPVLFYHSDVNKLEEIVLKQAIYLVFFSVIDEQFGAKYGIAIHFEHNLFSNHIATKETFGTSNPKLVNIEPAAIINRLKARNLALEIKASMPFFEIEFSAYKTRIRPYDKYGFLEGADLVIDA